MKKFEASRLAGGNKLFPPVINCDTTGITVKFPGIFGGETQRFSYSSIRNIKVKTPLIGYSTIELNVEDDWITAHGFTKDDARKIEEIIKEGQRGGSRLPYLLNEGDEDAAKNQNVKQEQPLPFTQQQQQPQPPEIHAPKISNQPSVASPPRAVPPPDGFFYYAMIGNKQRGPYNEIQFKRLIDNEMVSPQTKVWQEGMPKWQMAMDVREVAMLFPQLAAAMQQQSVAATTPQSSTAGQIAFMVYKDGQQAGPYTIDQLRQFAATGEFTQQVQVWTQGMAGWELAGNIPELAALFAPVMPSGAPPMPSEGESSETN